MAVASRTGPVLVFLAGSNGAGKTTFYRDYLRPLNLPFLNADERALQLRGESLPPGAGPVDRLAFEQTEELRRLMLDGRLSFCTETVFSDPQGAKLDFLREARSTGYTIFLVFIGISDPELSRARVAQRSRDGGHDVPDDKLLGRFPRTLQNLHSAIPLGTRRSSSTTARISSLFGSSRSTPRDESSGEWTRCRPGRWDFRVSETTGELQGTPLKLARISEPSTGPWPPPSRLRRSPDRPWPGRSSRRRGGVRS